MGFYLKTTKLDYHYSLAINPPLPKHELILGYHKSTAQILIRMN